MTDGIARVTDSPLFKMASWIIVGLLQALGILIVSSYSGSLNDIKQGLHDQGIRIGNLEAAVNAFGTSQATVQLRLSNLESTEATHGKAIDDIRDASQRNTFDVDRLQEILKTQTINTRPAR